MPINKNFKKIMSRFSKNDQEELKKIILNFHGLKQQQVKDLVMEVIAQMLEEMAKDEVSAGDVGMAIKALESMQGKLQQLSEEFELGEISEEELIQKFIGALQQEIQEKRHSQKQEELDNLPDFVKKEIKRQIYQFFVYEFHKFSNPNQLAGETAKENFLNNVINKGVGFAMKFAGREYVNDKDTIETIKNLDKNNNIGIGR
jgi:threonine synthase